MKKRYKGIIWDYNGTLIDDVHTALASVNDMLVKRGMDTITLMQYYRYLDTPIIKFYAHLFDLEQVPFAVITKEFAQGYEKHISANPLMEHADTVLSFAKEHGIKQVILSASHQQQIETMVKRLSISRYFTCISGAQDLNAQSKIDRGKQIIQRYKLDPAHVLVVGDTLHDYAVSKALQTDCVLLSKGHQGKADLLRAGVPVIDSLADLHTMLLSFNR